MSSVNQRRTLQIFVIVVLFGLTNPASAVDWSSVPGKDIVLFYPAQLSWEMVLTQDEHSGAKKFREGKDCRQCHEGEERASGMLLVADAFSDSAPIENKPGFIEATVKAAHDGENLQINVAFTPGEQPDAEMDKQFPAKVAVMFDDGGVSDARRAGCWATCHDNLARMPSGETAETTKYLARSRSQMTRRGGTEPKSAEVLESLRESGSYLEYWQARLRPDSAPDVIDGFILEERTQSAAPMVVAEASQENGKWSVIFSRPMQPGGLYKDFSPGKTYTVGVSVHAGHTAQRFHYVSLEKTLVIDEGSADFIAARDDDP
ncbi:MAG: cytochrome c-552 precursor [Alphaproteobacteria bacterium]|nr:cytochrome c-552 precursor [Alphaproteobacteria bacterium]